MRSALLHGFGGGASARLSLRSRAARLRVALLSEQTALPPISVAQQVVPMVGRPTLIEASCENRVRIAPRAGLTQSVLIVDPSVDNNSTFAVEAKKQSEPLKEFSAAPMTVGGPKRIAKPVNRRIRIARNLVEDHIANARQELGLRMRRERFRVFQSEARDFRLKRRERFKEGACAKKLPAVSLCERARRPSHKVTSSGMTSLSVTTTFLSKASRRSISAKEIG